MSARDGQPGPLYGDRASTVKRSWAETDALPKEAEDGWNEAGAPLTNVLDWMGRSEVNTASFPDLSPHDTAGALPSDSSSTTKPLTDVLDWLGQYDLRDLTYTRQLTGDIAGDERTDETPRANSAHPMYGSSALPKLHPRTLKRAISQADTSFQQPVGDQAVGSNDFGHEGQNAAGDTVVSAPSWRPRRSYDSSVMPLESESDGPCMVAGAVCRSNSNAEEGRWSIEEEEEVEWHQRQERTGTVGRLVHYQENDRPKEDLLLRGGTGAHVVVAAVRDGGPASKVGVKAGDRLVSIDGSKAFFNLPADTIREQLKAPTVLVFLGFVGKLQAEVRLTCSPRVCGLNNQQSAFLNNEFGLDSHCKIEDEKVFNTSGASLFLFTSTPGYDDGNHSENPSMAQADDENDQTIDKSMSRRLLFELQRPEANNILRKALGSRMRENNDQYTGYTNSILPSNNHLMHAQPIFMNTGGISSLAGKPARPKPRGVLSEGDGTSSIVRKSTPRQATGLSRERLGAVFVGTPPLPEMVSSDQQALDMMLTSDLPQSFATPYSSAEIAAAESLDRNVAADAVAEAVDAAADRAVDVACADPDLRPTLFSPEEPWLEPIIPSENDANPTLRARQPMHAVQDFSKDDIKSPRSPSDGNGNKGLSSALLQSRGPQVGNSQVTRCNPDGYVEPVIT